MSATNPKIAKVVVNATKSCYNEHNFYLHLGKLIEKARKRSGRTQEETAHELGISRVTIGLMERGEQKIPFHTIFKLADILKVPFTAFVPEDLVDLLGNNQHQFQEFSKTDLERLRLMLDRFDPHRTANPS